MDIRLVQKCRDLSGGQLVKYKSKRLSSCWSTSYLSKVFNCISSAAKTFILILRIFLKSIRSSLEFITTYSNTRFELII